MDEVAGRLAAVSSEQREPVKPMRFSLFFFSADGSKATANKYHLLLEAAKFADQHGFAAIWTPERHFQDFGGLYPNPAVLSAALAMVTVNIQIRAGSVVLPLHSPIRVAEEWSLADNLSHGRVGIACASGWHPADFVFAREAFDERKEVMVRAIEVIRRLWAGQDVTVQGGHGLVEARLLPRPIQPELPMWITTGGNPATWSQAGELGTNVLAALMGQSIEDLGDKIALYRESLARHGHDPQQGQVTVMLHTFVGDDDAAVKARVRAPLCEYLRRFVRQQDTVDVAQPSEFQQLTEADQDQLISFAFERFFRASSLLGTEQKCARLIDRLAEVGVDEIASLIDFGLDVDAVLDGLNALNDLRRRYDRSALEPPANGNQQARRAQAPGKSSAS